MAKMRFVARTTEIIKKKYVEKKTFKLLFSLTVILLILLGISVKRLHNLHQFDALYIKLNNYYWNL